jgi:uncharacterized membrane protein YagU involved in acid resistance
MERIVDGALGGVTGAACKSALRFAMHRFGALEKTPPQTVEEWLVQEVVPPAAPAPHAAHQLLAEAVHLGYGSFLGGVLGLLRPRERRWPLWRGALYGFAVWAVSLGALLPALGVTRPIWRASALENGINIAAHVLFGTVAALSLQELEAQEGRPSPTPWHRRRARTA